MCEFTMIDLSNPKTVTLTFDVSGEKVQAAYEGEEFEAMDIDIDQGGITKITFTGIQPDEGVVGEGRRWCRDNAAAWQPWTPQGGTITFVANVPPDMGSTWAYEFRFALASVVKNGGKIVWRDPKVIISRVGGDGGERKAAR